MKFFKKHYMMFSGLFLLLLLIFWTDFNNRTLSSTPVSADSSTSVTTDLQASAGSKTDPLNNLELTISSSSNEETGLDQLTPTPLPTPTQEPTPIPEPTAVPTPAPTATPTPTPEPTPIPSPYEFKYAVADVNSMLFVRSGPGSDKGVTATFSRNGYCEVLEKGAEWTKLKTGDVVGYSATDYLLFGQKAIDRMRALDALYVMVNEIASPVYSAKDYQSESLEQATSGLTYRFIPEQSDTEWYAVKVNNKTGYLPSKCCTEYITLSPALPRD